MSSPPTLLLADDSVAIQRIVALTFADQPLRLIVAKDGQDAINRMAAERPDIVLADTNMPCVDGYELARWVRQQPHLDRVPVLLLAGATDPVDEQRLHDSGANGVLEKPFEPNHVISRVKELLGMKGAPAPEPTRLIPPPNRPPSGVRRPAAPVDAPAADAGAGEAPAAVPVEAMAAPADGAGTTSIAEAFAVAEARGRVESSAPDADLVAATAGEGRVADDGRPDDAAVEPAWPSPPATAQADVFARLLAAEQGDPSALAPLQAPPSLSDESLDAIATRLQARLARAVNDSVAGEMRAAVAESLQAAVDGSLLGTVRGAVQEEVARTLPAAVQAAIEQVVRDEVAAAIQTVVRDAVERALPEALAAATRAAVAEVVPGVVRDTAERLVSDEIARIRGIGA